jgi:hypothetical protein
LRGASMPEALAWDAVRIAARLDDLQPDILVCVTGRAYDARLSASARLTILDLVDVLSASYLDRARLSSSPGRRLGLRALSWSAHRFEQGATSRAPVVTAAGWSEARTLGLEWVPNVLDSLPSVVEEADAADVVFFGNLAYPPNRAAVLRLARMWPLVLQQRPGTTALVAGANLDSSTAALAARLGWRTVADYPDWTWVCARGRIAVCPVEHASGMQNKVLEAAAMARPLVVTPQVLAGFQPGLPAHVAATDADFARRIVELLVDPRDARRRGALAREHVEAQYSASGWAQWASQLLAQAARGKRA